MTKEQNLFEIHISEKNVQSSTVPVSWCLNEKLLQELADENLQDPHVVIVTAPLDEKQYHIKKEVRKVVPLKDLIAYIDFKHPGENIVGAFVSRHSGKEAKSTYLSKNKGEYRTTILHPDGSTLIYDKIIHRSDSIVVNVPQECFAPEPLQWEQDWVNYFFIEKAYDQCNYRRRRILAYTFQPLFVIINLLLRWGALLVAFFIGARGCVNWKQAFQPINIGLIDAIIEIMGGGSVFFGPTKNVVGVKEWAKQFGLALFFPPILSVLGISCYFNGVVATIAKIGFVLGILAGVIIIISGLLLVRIKYDDNIDDFFDKRKRKKKAKEAEKAALKPKYWYQDKESVQALVCDGTRKPVKVAQLPKRHRSVRLRFQEIKAKVCRPFAG